MMKRMFLAGVVMMFLAGFIGQAVAEEIKVTGIGSLVNGVCNKIREFFPNAPLVAEPSAEVREAVVYFIDEDGSVLGAYPIPPHAFNGDGQILPPAVLACVQVFTGQNPAKEYRAGNGQWEEMTARHSSGLDVHKHVPIFTPYVEVVDRFNGEVTLKWTVVSRDYRLCYYRYNITKATYHAHIPRGWVNLPFEGDGNPDVFTISMFGPPTGYGGF